MAKKSDFEIRFDPEKSVAILPPNDVETVNRTIGQGPNSQQIEHCLFASTLEELFHRAPIFYMRVPTCNKGETRDWPMGDWPKCEVGQHYKIGLPIAVLEARRVDDYLLDIKGLIKTPNETTYGDVKINNYSVQTREGRVIMSSIDYCHVISLWQQHFYETM